jgi:thioredoxin 1
VGLLDRLFGAKPQVVPERVRDLATFRRVVLKSELPVLVDVWSPSCGPCKMLEPVLLDVATRYAGRVKVVEIATADSEPALLAKLEARSTPTVIVFDCGEEIGRQVGYRPAAWFDQMIAAELTPG